MPQYRIQPEKICSGDYETERTEVYRPDFASGKMCVTGTKSTHNAALAAQRFAYIVEKVGFKPALIDFKVQNIVGTIDVGFPIRLEGLVFAHSTFASYEPELFPGLIYRLVSPRVVFLIFVSGKVVITGAKTEKDMTDALTKMYPVLVEFRKQNVTQIPGIPTPVVASAPPAGVGVASTTGSSGAYENNNPMGGGYYGGGQTSSMTSASGGGMVSMDGTPAVSS
jgi:TATA-box binding protein (TBP), component of TFIID and TFIIIB